MYNHPAPSAAYFCNKPQTVMKNIEDAHYAAIAELLLIGIGSGNYYNGSIGYETEDWCGELRATLIVYRQPLDLPDDPAHLCERITDIVPVWWEFNTYENGAPTANNFSWSELKEYLL